MMNKNTILTVIVILLFGISGAVIYYGIFAQPSATTMPIEANQRNIVNLMPYGEKLDFSPLEERPGVLPPYVYKQLNPAQDVGVQVRDMIRNATPGEPGGTPNVIF